MALEWHTIVGMVVSLVAGLFPHWVHRLADRLAPHWLGRLLHARDPPVPPHPLDEVPVVVSDDQLRQITQAVMEGQAPLVEATRALTAQVAAVGLLLPGDRTIAANITFHDPLANPG